MLEIGSFAFRSAWFLLLLPVLWYLIYILRSKKAPVSGIYLPTLQAVKDVRSLKTRLMPWLPWLRYIGLSLLIIALARPQQVLTEETIKGEGIDICMVIDLSSSMLARDFNPNRLEATKELATEFADKRQSDRLAVVTFAAEAFSQCPLTADKRIIAQVLNSLQAGMLADGTAIGMGLAAGVNRLKDSQNKSKVIILLTDGMNNAGYIEPLTAAKLAADLGIKVYVIGVGTQGQALAPIDRAGNGQYIFGYTQVEIDESLMAEIAELTKGQYFRATDKNSLEGIYNRIDQLEKSEIDIAVTKKNVDFFRVFLLSGLLLLMIELILKNTWLRTPALIE